MAKNNRRARNNNPEGRNQYSNGWMDTARERPFAAAATAAAAVGAGVFLWSRRNQITEQIAGLSDQISEWREGLGSETEFAGDGTESFMARSGSPSGRTNQSDIAEEALTLKEAGKARRGSNPMSSADTKAGATSF